MADAVKTSSIEVAPVELLEVADPSGYFEIKATAESATLIIKSTIQLTKIILTNEMILGQLGKAGVRHCIDEGLVTEMIQKKLFDIAHVVAMAKAPQPGQDARLEELVKIDADNTPKTLDGGRVDFKNVDNIHTVQEGTVLAIKHPATVGEAGIDLFGKQTPVKPGKDVSFKVGANVLLSADGMQLIAGKSGFLFHQASAICIGEGYEVKGDVGFKTGNIHYYGTITVKGNVCDGFAVEAKEDITIEGTVDGSNITSTDGAVFIKQAVYGHNRSALSAKTDIHLQSAQDAKIECAGALEVQKLLRNCEVSVGSIQADAAGCILQGGHLRVFGSAVVANVGGEGVSTLISIVDKEVEARRDELRKTQTKIEDGQTNLQAAVKRLKGMKSLADKAGGKMSERMINEMKGAVQHLSEIQKSIQVLELRVQELKNLLSISQGHAYSITIREKVLGSVRISLYGSNLDLTQMDGGKQWTWTEEGLVGRSLV